ncbi:MAG: OadG family protein [Desulfobacterales bacterium]
MKGIEAVLYYDGPAMAVLGISVVFMALIVLAVIISGLHIALFFWDNKKLYFNKACLMFSSPEKTPEPAAPGPYFDDIHESARQINLLVHAIGEPFSLPRLIRRAENIGISHAHSTVSHLIVNNLIVPDRKGYFLWNQQACDRLLRQSKENR